LATEEEAAGSCSSSSCRTKVADAERPLAILITIAASSLIRVHLPRCRAVLPRQSAMFRELTRRRRRRLTACLCLADSALRSFSPPSIVDSACARRAARAAGYLAPARHRSSAAEEDDRRIWMTLLLVAIVRHLRAFMLPPFTALSFPAVDNSQLIR